MSRAYYPIDEVWRIEWIFKAWCWHWITTLDGAATIGTRMTAWSALDSSKVYRHSIAHYTRGFKPIQLKQFNCFKNTSNGKFALNTSTWSELWPNDIKFGCEVFPQKLLNIGSLLGLGVLPHHTSCRYHVESSYHLDSLLDQLAICWFLEFRIHINLDTTFTSSKTSTLSPHGTFNLSRLFLECSI